MRPTKLAFAPLSAALLLVQRIGSPDSLDAAGACAGRPAASQEDAVGAPFGRGAGQGPRLNWAGSTVRYLRIVELVGLLLVGLLLAPRAVSALWAPDPAAWEPPLVAGWSGEGAPAAFTDLRALNPEYDLIARTFLVLGLADRALAEPARRAATLGVVDAIVDDTLAAEAASDPRHWLLSYADAQAWRGTGRSLFVDGEVLVMLGARRILADDRPELKREMDQRAAWVVAAFGSAPLAPLAESYPDEGWLFCHGMALVGLRMQELLDGADHSAARRAFVQVARQRLVDGQTGLLISSFDMDGRSLDGPEGSSLWFAVVALRLVDPALADAQYALARQHLGRSLLGLGYSREWPAGVASFEDVDSGPIVPLLEASASASGLALAASRAFGDETWNGELVAALGAAELILALDPRLARIADNAVGRAVLLWGQSFGPLWQRLALDRPLADAGPTGN